MDLVAPNKVLMLVQQVFYPLGHLLSPSLYFQKSEALIGHHWTKIDV